MLTLLWNLSRAIRGYLRFYMPTNQAVDWLRTPRGPKWAIPVALVATPAYLYLVSICATVVERGGPGWINVIVILFFWNASKFAWVGVLSPGWMVASTRSRHEAERAGRAEVTLR